MLIRFSIQSEPEVIEDATDGLIRVVRDPRMLPGWADVEHASPEEFVDRMTSGQPAGTMRINGRFTSVLNMARLVGRYSSPLTCRPRL